MKFILRTLDGIEADESSPDIDETASTIMRPCYPRTPCPFLYARRYERTGDVIRGLPVFAEVEEKP